MGCVNYFSSGAPHVLIPLHNMSSVRNCCQVVANDGDSGEAGRVIYSILSGNDNSAYNIDPDSGHIWVVNGNRLEHQTAVNKRLLIQAKDGEFLHKP